MSHGHTWQVWTEPLAAEDRAVVAKWAAGYPALLPGAGLRLLRECMDLGRGDLARLLGVAERRVARWENGKAGEDALAERAVRALFLDCSFADVASFLEMVEDWPAWIRLQGGKVVERGYPRPETKKRPVAAPAARTQRKKRGGKPALRVVA